MKAKQMMALVMAALFTLSVAGEAMAAAKNQTRIRTPTSTTCTPKLDGSGR